MAKQQKSPEATHSTRQIQNRRARHEYEILRTVEAGLVLVGSEVKSIFLGRAHLSDTYCRLSGGEAFLVNFDIEPYEHSPVFAHERKRDRKLLLHRKEIEDLERESLEKGLTLIPLRVYFSHGRAKVEIGIGRGRKLYDKRQKIAEQDANRNLARELATLNKGRPE